MTRGGERGGGASGAFEGERELDGEAQRGFGAPEGAGEARAEDSGALDVEDAGGKLPRGVGQRQGLVSEGGPKEELEPESRHEFVPRVQVEKPDPGARGGVVARLE